MNEHHDDLDRFGPMRRLALLGSALVFLPFQVIAESPIITEMSSEPAMQNLGSWRDAVAHGGWPMIVLAVMSVFMLALVLYFLAILRPGQIAPWRLRRDIIEKLREGNTHVARKLCDDKSCPLSAVTLTALDYLRNVPEPDIGLLKDMVEGEGIRQADRLQGQTQLLLDVAVIAPMVGLLGTVIGMWEAFSGIAYQIESAKPIVLAQGVAKALITTAFGLLVGIPSMMFYAYFRRRVGSQVALLETASAEVLTALISKPEP